MNMIITLRPSPVDNDGFLEEIYEVLHNNGYIGAVLIVCDKKGLLKTASVSENRAIDELLSELGEKISQKMASKEIIADKFLSKYSGIEGDDD
jgi:hypothetical protein